MYEEIVNLRRQRVSFAVCTVVDTSGSSPRKKGAKMLVRRGGEIVGTIGGGAIEFTIIKEAVEAIDLGQSRLVKRHLTHELAMCCGGGMSVFVEVQSYAPRLYVFGAGHVGAALATFAAGCGFVVCVVDARSELTGALNGVEVLCGDPVELIEALDFDERGTYVVVVTHDHGLDEELVSAALTRPTKYLGCIGSQRKAQKFRQRLNARGHTEEAIVSMRTPMGLDIGALTPEEIAISTLAEMISVRRTEKSEAL